MSTHEIASKVAELRELKRMAEDLNAEIEALQDSIKDHMAANEVDELAGTDWKITWKLVKTRRFDSKAFKATHAELYDQYCTETFLRYPDTPCRISVSYALITPRVTPTY